MEEWEWVVFHKVWTSDPSGEINRPTVVTVLVLLVVYRDPC